MKSLERVQKIVVNTTIASLVILMAAAPLFLQQPNHSASAHFLGTINTIDKYQVAFQPTPQLVRAGENTSLHFSIWKDGANIGNVNVALAIKEKASDKVVEQVPFKRYEIADLTIPYKFKNITDYSVEFMMVPADGGQQAQRSGPLKTDFDLAVKEYPVISSTELLAAAGPYAAAMVAGVVLVFKKVR
jgi:hypothetical protein